MMIFAIHHSPLTLRLPFTIHCERIMDNAWIMDNCKLIIATTEGVA